MRAAVFDRFRGPIVVREVAEPACPDDGVIVEVKACGVCRSDWHGWTGADSDVTAPHVPGHELAGVIIATGPKVRAFGNGDRVTVPFIVACGDCAECRGGDPTICDHQHVVGFSGWGAFAERIAIPRADFNLVRVPDAIDFTAAAALGCRMTTAFRALVDRAELRDGEWLAVHGCGGAGLSAIMIGAALGARIIAVDVNEAALALAHDLGAERSINPAKEKAAVGTAIRDFSGGGAHVSLDALGITATFHNSIAGLRKLGRHVQIGLPLGEHARPTVPLLDAVYSRQISILGTRGIAAKRFPALLEMIAAGMIDPLRLVTKRIGLEGAGAALAAMDGFSGSGITVIEMGTC